MKKIYKSGDINIPAKVKSLLGRKQYLPTLPAYDITKSFAPDEEMIISGIANAAILDRWNEIVDPDAWDLENYNKNPIILLQHDYQLPIGICLSVGATKKGLEFEARIGDPKLAPLTNDQIYARSLLAQKILRCLSVGFIPRIIEWDEEAETLRYTDVELLEISVVSIPMQQDSLITSVKSIEGRSMSKEQVNKSEDSFAELKGMINDHMECSKQILDMVKKMADKMEPADEPADDSEKALSQTILDQAEEIKTLKATLLAAEKSIHELCDNLQKQGLIKGENL